MDEHVSYYDDWVVDTGTTSHICNQCTAFTTYQPLGDKLVSGPWRLKNHCPRYRNSRGRIHSQRKQIYFVIGKRPTYPFKSQQPFLTWTLGYICRKIYQRGICYYSQHKRWKIHHKMCEGHQQFISN